MNHKRLFLVFLLVIPSLCVVHGSLSTRLDSLNRELNNAPHDTIRCNIYLQMGDLLEHAKPDSALYYYHKCLELAQNKRFQRQESVALRYIGIIIRGQGHVDKALEYYAQSLAIAQEIEDMDLIASCYNSIGILHRGQGSFEMALDYYQRALKVFQQTGNQRGVANTSNSMGVVFHSLGRYDEAVEKWLDALAFFEESDEKRGLAAGYNNIGLVYYEQENFETAKHFIRQSLEIREELGDVRGVAACYTNIGSVYFHMHQYDQSVNYHQKALQLSRNLDDKNGLATGYNNIGAIYRKQGNFSLAADYLEKSLQIRKELSDKNGVSSAHISLANLYLDMASGQTAPEKTKSLTLATQYGENAYEIALEIGSLPLQKNSAEVLYQTFKELNNYSRALDYAEIYIARNDSMFNEEKTNALAKMQTRFETEKKQQEIEKQQLIIQHQHAESQKQLAMHRFLIIVLVLFLLIAAGAFWGYMVINRTNKRLKDTLAKLAKSENNLKVLLLTKDRLYSIIAHDIKSPLAGLAGLSNLLVEDASKMQISEIQSYSQLIHASAQKILGLTENLTHWANSQTGNIKIEPDKISLKKLTDDVLNVLHLQAHAKQISIEANIPEQASTFADYNTLSTVVRNLISNAIKFTHRNGTITLSVEQQDAHIFYRISDNGMGISEANQQKLFKIERKLQTNGTENESGTGLGLIVCKEFVEANGGQIMIESTPGEGTTFILQLNHGKKNQPAHSS